jgi:hypothetical protein
MTSPVAGAAGEDLFHNHSNLPMKKFFLLFLLAGLANLSYGQSQSYRMLRNQFEDSPEVKSYRLSGLMCKIIVNIVENDDERLAAALKEVRKVRLMTIPKAEFAARNVTVKGFKERLPKDNFELLADFDKGDESLAFYHRLEKKNRNRYFVIIDEGDKVIAIEMKGFIDPSILSDESTFTSL